MSEDIFHLGMKALIRNKRGEVLLLKKDPATVGGNEYWDMPGGRVARGQSVEETLRREVEEETGVREIVIGVHVGMVLSPFRIKTSDSDVGLILSVYQCQVPEAAEVQPADTLVAYEWVAPAEAAKRIANKYPPDFCAMIANIR